LTNATTGSERVVPEQQPPAGERYPLPARLVRPLVAHWQFGLVVLAAIAMRAIVILGYPPILWFNDSYNYIQDALMRVPDEVRPNGYPFFLDLLLPLHSLYPIGLLQAAMGAGMGVAIYAVLRHRGLPWWGATLPTLPVLFDAYQLHLEHMVTADTLFIFLVTIAVVMLCWSDRPSVLAIAIAGLFIGYATLVRSVGEPLLIVVLIAMLVRRAGWLRLITLAVVGLAPIGAYMLWFHNTYGQYALTESQGTFLYSRVSTFAYCYYMKPPALLHYLCDTTPLQYRPPPGDYIWSDVELPPYQTTYTPLYRALSNDTALRFTAPVNAQTEEFAVRAIEAQKMAYVSAVTDDILHTFGWNRQPDPNDYYGNGPVFEFVSGGILTEQIPWYATPVEIPGDPGPPKTINNYCDAKCQQGDVQAYQIQQAEQAFAGTGYGYTSAVRPWVRILQIYQRFVYLRGTLLAVIVLIGAAGIVARWRRWGGLGLLPWLVGAVLIVLPPMTAGFSYRYVLAAVPAVCLAAGLAFVPRLKSERVPEEESVRVPEEESVRVPGTKSVRAPGTKSVRSLTADLRRHLGRGIAVDQE
jgi:hypothetical protein